MTRDPFRIEGPAIISFSGGRTSAYMLWRILQAHGGTLPDDVKACFANTGKEMPETLDFVRDCGERWGVDIAWLEYRDRAAKPMFAVVDHATASRRGEPYAAAIRHRSYLPNPVARWCTSELKVIPIRHYADSLGFSDWGNVVGLRADEPKRLATMRAAGDNRQAPLARAGITRSDIAAFWRAQNFDLALPSVNGTTPMGNCNYCFLKGASTIQGIMRLRPDDWWERQEAAIGGTFRSDRPSYAALRQAIERQQELDFGDDQRIDCFCSEDQT